jgi:hypothetical protein
VMLSSRCIYACFSWHVLALQKPSYMLTFHQGPNTHCRYQRRSLKNFNRNSLLWHRCVIYPAKCLPNVIFTPFNVYPVKSLLHLFLWGGAYFSGAELILSGLNLFTWSVADWKE